MVGLTIQCPFCGKRAGIRTSKRESLLVITADLYCSNCNKLKAKFMGEITEIKRAIYVDCPESAKWDKPESEIIKEKEAKGEQADAQQKAPREKTPLERILARQSLTPR